MRVGHLTAKGFMCLQLRRLSQNNKSQRLTRDNVMHLELEQKSNLNHGNLRACMHFRILTKFELLCCCVQSKFF